MHTKLKIIGCGGHARVVLDALSLNHKPFTVSLCDSNEHLLNTEFCGHVIDSTLKDLPDFIGYVHMCIGNNSIREKLYQSLHPKATLWSIKHPNAVISASSFVGEGSFIAAQSVLAPDSVIGRGCIINHGAVIDHEVLVGDYSHIAPNSTLGGSVRIGKGVLVGSGAVILPGIHIGDKAIIAAGAVVIKDVESQATVKGVPAV